MAWHRVGALLGGLVAGLMLSGDAGSVAQVSASPTAFVLLGLPSSRVVAQARPEILDMPVAPGSLMKAFALVAALESGAATAETRIVCRRTMDLDGRPITCVHPDLHRGLTGDEALAHSCNVYFGTIARRLRRDALDALLIRAGLQPTSPSVPMTRAVLGLEGVHATPRRWLDAFLRLSGSMDPAITMQPETRAFLRQGLAGAAHTGGTAEALDSAGFDALAKTGTVSMPGGGSLGLVTAVIGADHPTHAIIMLAPGTSGAHAAALVSQVLVTQAVPHRTRGIAARAARATQRPGTAGPANGGGPTLRVGTTGHAGGGVVVTSLPLEELVARGVSGEGGADLPAAAQRALAIAIRSFAIRHAGRHAAEGYDLCDLTHCMSLRPANAAARAAALATAGMVLQLEGRPVDVYFSASCGGHTERPSSVWSRGDEPPHLPARPDSVCRGERPWIRELSEPQLRMVLAALGLRGPEVRRFSVAARTPSGRAASLAAEGLTPGRVDAEAFRLEVGRRLGWQILRSSLYDIERTGTGFRFVGRGFGHGVGLCVRGAGIRAAGGADAVAILGTYFPGTSVGPMPSETDVRVVLPAGEQHQRAAVGAMIGSQLRRLADRLKVDVPWRVDVVFHPSVEAYTRETGMPWWSAGRTRGTRIDLLPLGVLRQRRVLETTVQHELVHLLTAEALAGRPLWIHEGLAQVMAGEYEGTNRGTGEAGCPGDDNLRRASGAAEWRRAYAAAARCAAAALERDGDWRRMR